MDNWAYQFEEHLRLEIELIEKHSKRVIEAVDSIGKNGKKALFIACPPIEDAYKGRGLLWNTATLVLAAATGYRAEWIMYGEGDKFHKQLISINLIKDI